LCLVANDPADMLGVVISHSMPVQLEPLGLCKRCVLEIVKSAMTAEFIQPEEVFGDAASAATSLDNPDGAHPADNHPAGAGGAESPEGEDPREHRPDLEMPARGEELTSIQDQPKAKRGVS